MTGLPLDYADQRPLLVRGPTVVSRGVARERAVALRERLLESGARRAMLIGGDPLELLVAIDATARAGIDLVVAHAYLTPAQLEYAASEAGVDALIDGNAIERRDAAPSASPEAAATPTSKVILMTSGTTGVPKLVAHSLASLMARIPRREASAEPGTETRWLLTYSPTGYAGLQVILTAVASGSAVVVPESRTPAGFVAAATTGGVTHISATPTYWRALLLVVHPGQLALRQITLGGEAVDQPTLDRLRVAFPDARITHTYASTEAGLVYAVHDGIAGFPVAWLDQPPRQSALRIVDGFLEVRTLSAMQGYVAATAVAAPTDGWVRTADRCEIRGDRVMVLGREDGMINVAGSKVYPHAVEQAVLGVPGVADVRVYGVANPISGALVAADVVLEPGHDAATVRPVLLATCRSTLASFEVPRVVQFVPSLRIADSGKKALV